MSQRSGLAERTDLDGVRLELVQIPMAAWVPAALLAVFGAFGLTSILPAAAPVAVFLFIGVVLSLFLMNLAKRTVTVEISTTEITVSGWIGKLPRPGRVVLPVLGTQMETRAGAVVNGVQVWVLTLTHGERKIVVPSLRCTAGELDVLEDRLQGMRTLALAMHGAGEDEIPDALDAILARAEPVAESPDTLSHGP